MPTTTVVIPTSNRVGYVDKAIASALRADGVDAVVVVDDGSTDGTPELLASFGDRISVVSGRFGSPAAARNAGIAACRTDLVALLDSDDEMLPGKVTALAPHFADNRVALAHGRVEVIDEDGHPDEQSTERHREFFDRAEREPRTYAGLLGDCVMFSSAVVLRRSAFLTVGGYDEGLTLPYEDYDLYLRLARDHHFVLDHTIVARYRTWAGNFDVASHAAGMIAMAEKHRASLRAVRSPDASRARFHVNSRLATSHALLGHRGATALAVGRAIAASPRRAAVDPAVRGGVLRAVAPTSLVNRRRSREWARPRPNASTP